MTVPERPPSSTMRVRAFRQREEDGDLLVSLKVSVEETAKLLKCKLLGLDELEDKGAIAHAIHRLIRERQPPEPDDDDPM